MTASVISVCPCSNRKCIPTNGWAEFLTWWNELEAEKFGAEK